MSGSYTKSVIQLIPSYEQHERNIVYERQVTAGQRSFRRTREQEHPGRGHHIHAAIDQLSPEE